MVQLRTRLKNQLGAVAKDECKLDPRVWQQEHRQRDQSRNWRLSGRIGLVVMARESLT